MAIFHGTNANDVFSAPDNARDDKINGRGGNDILDGGEGDDSVQGEDGEDVVDGGSGNDIVDAGKGDDTGIYTLAQNQIGPNLYSTDVYDGGRGFDTLQIHLTTEEFIRFREELIELQDHVENNADSGHEGSNDGFVTSWGLTVRNWEALEIFVDGEIVDPRENQAPQLDLDADDSTAPGTGFATTFTEGEAPVAVADDDLRITDLDGNTVGSAAVELTNPLDGADESVSLTAFGTALAASLGVNVDTATAGLLALVGEASIADYENLLREVVYDNQSNDPTDGNRILEISVDDGADPSNIAITTIMVVEVNDAPVNEVPGAQTVDEDASLGFSAALGNAIRVGDVDAGAEDLEVALTVAHGTLTLSQQGGLVVAGDGTGAVVLTGSLGAINAALDGLVYAPDLDFNGTDTLAITSNDLGHTGAGGALQDFDTVQLEVRPVNDAPVNSVPLATQSLSEDSSLTFSPGNGNAISVADRDASEGSGEVQVTLAVGNGRLDLGSTGGLSSLSGNGTATVVLTGSLGAVNAALDGLIYSPDADFFGSDSLTVTTNDLGNTGAPGALEDVDTVSLQVAPINDAPVNSVPGTQNVGEDTPLVFSLANGNEISVADDSGPNPILVSLQVLEGTLTLSTQAGLIVSGDGTPAVTLTGTTSAINAALAGLVYTPSPEFSGDDTFTITTNDLGNTGVGGPLQDADSFLLQVEAINDPPVNQVPGDQTLQEDASLSFSVASGNAISVSDVDVDAGTGELQVTLAVGNGVLVLGSTIGLSAVAGNGTATVILSGAVASVNAALDGLSYSPTSDFFGADSLTVTTNDLGNSGAGGPQQDIDVVALSVLPVNDAPVNSVPASQVLDENALLTFSAATGNAISTADDSGSSDIRVSVSVGNGSLTLSQHTGLAVTGDGSSAVTMQGALSAVNAALEGLIYAPDLDFNGIDTLTIQTDDLGNTGVGGPMQDVDTVSLEVGAVNNAPVNSVPGSQVLNEDTPLTFAAGNGNAISVSDVDAAEGTGQLQVTLSVGQGSLTLSQQTGLSVTGDGTGTVMLTGLVVNVNAALQGLVYAPAADYNGADALTVITNDLGNFGAGGPQQDVDVVALTVAPVNDAPVNQVPTAQTLNEDTPLTFSAAGGNAISVSDVDANEGTGQLQVTLSVGQGSLTLSQQTGLSVTGDGTGTVMLTGLVVNVNAALQGLVYAPAADFNGGDTLTVITSDLGNTGLGGPQQDVDVVALSVLPVNDAPVNSVPGSQTLDEDTTLTFSAGNANAIVVSDVDANEGTGQLQVTLSVGQGSLTLSQQTGLSVTGDGTGNVTLTGLVANVNAALQGLVYAPAADFSGGDVLTVTTNDLGNTGAPGALQDIDVVALTVAPINDAPVHSVPGSQVLNEDTSLTFAAAGGNALSISDDSGANAIQVRLAVAEGTLVLSQQTGLSVTGDGTGLVTIFGAVDAINAGLEGLVYTPGAEFSGTDTLTIDTDDLGHSGTGGPLQDSDSVSITVVPFNDAPVNSVPLATQFLDEDTQLVFSAAGGNMISVDDIDSNTGSLRSTLEVQHGTLTVITVDGTIISAPRIIIVEDDLAKLNAALDGLTYVPDADYFGDDTLTVTTNDLGNTGVGGPMEDVDQVAIRVNAINDAPVNSVPGAQTLDEDTPLTFSAAGGNAIAVSDVDVDDGTGQVQTTLSVGQGSLTLSQQTGLAVAGDGTGTVVLTGLVADVNAALQGLVYAPAANFNGADALSITTNDLGNSGAGGPQQDVDVVSLVVQPVNDAPVNQVPQATQTLDEDATLTFSAGNGNAIAVADLDAGEGTGEVRATLSVGQGSLTLSQQTGLVVTGDGTGVVTLQGALSAVNAALEGLRYAPDLDFNGADSLILISNDLGNTGSPGALQDVDVVAIGVRPVNDAPMNSVPQAPQTVDEDTPLTFAAGNGNAISVSDVDAAEGTGQLQVTLSVGQGSLTLSQQTGLSVTGDGTGTVMLTGLVVNVNAALQGLVYAPAADYNGADALTVITNDLGNFGAGGPQQDVDVVALTVAPVNDAPVNQVPTAQTLNEDTTLTFSAAGGNAISVSDVDAAEGTGQLQVTLSVGQGSLTLSQQTGLSVTGDGTSTVVLTGLVANVNAALQGLVYAPAADFNGGDTLTVITSDLGNTGLGGPQQDVDVVALSVLPVNDAPVNAVPGSQTLDEDTTLTFSAGNGNAIVVSDVDANEGTGQLQVTLSVGQGSLTLSQQTGLAVTGDGTGTVVLTGLVANVNAALQGLVYAPDADFDGADALTVTTNDLGNTGAPGALQDVDVVALTVAPINDAPVHSVPGSQVLNEDTSLTFAAAGGNALSISDDSGPNAIQVRLAVAEGALTLSQQTGLSVTGDGTGLVTIFGAVDAINAGLEGLVYTPGAEFSGNDTLTIDTDDLGHSGSGGPLQDADSVSITVVPFNDAPVNSVPLATQFLDEDTQLVFSAAGGNMISVDDIDSDTGSLRSTLEVQHGTLTVITVDGTIISAPRIIIVEDDLAKLNAALDGLTYAPDADYFGDDTLTITTNDLGNTGVGGPMEDVDQVAIRVNAINDAPVNSVPAAQTLDEDTPLTFSAAGGNAISIADDSGPNPIQLTLSVGQGALTLSQQTDLSVTGDGTGFVTILGALSAVNAALEGLVYTPDLDFNGDDSLTVATNDLGNTGMGGALQDVDVVALSVMPVNDAPVNSVAGLQNVDEDTALTFAAANANAITVSDVDAADGTGELRVTLVVGQGTLVLGSTAGLVDVAGNGTSTTTMRGSVAALNAALEGLTYTGDADFNGDDSLTVITNDLGNTGDGGARQTTSTVALSVDAVNDAPVNSVPQTTQTLDEDSSLTFSTGNGNAISVADLDADEGTGQLQVTLSVGQGSLTLSQQTGLAVTGDGTGMIELTGLVANVNAALEGLLYAPAADYNGADALTVITNDLGNHGAPGALQDVDTVSLMVAPVNDAPVNRVPMAQTLNEDTPLTFSAAGGNAIVVSDVDAAEGTNEVGVTLSVGQGSLSLSQQTGLMVTGDGTGNVVLTGLVANVNAALQGLVYVPTADFNGTDALTVTTNDLGNTGAPGALQAFDVVALSVVPVNDAPVNSVPGIQNVDEDTTLTFSAGNANAIIVSDVDADEGTGQLQVTLSVGQGSLTLSQQTGLSVSGDGTGNVMLTGLVANVNAALEGLVYAPAADFNGMDALTVTTNDLGNTGAPGALQDVDVVALAVVPVNDAPVNSVPGNQILNEDTTLTFATGSGNAISVADLDAAEGSGQLQVTLAVGHGALKLSQQTGLSVTGDGTGTVVLTGLVADVNAAIEGLVYAPDVDFDGMDSLTVTTNDLGNHGAPGALQDSDSVSITVVPFNDAPVNSVPLATQVLDEDTQLVFSAGNGNMISVDDVDSNGGSLRTTLEVEHGTLTVITVDGTVISAPRIIIVEDDLAKLNAALDGLTYAPDADYFGDDTLTITTNDLGNTGVGGPMEDVDQVAIRVNPVNDAPVNSVPGAQTLDEDTPLTFSAGNGNAISIADDSGPNPIQLTLSVGQGSLMLSQQTGLSVTGDGTGFITILGALSAVNAALEGLVYTPDLDFNGDDALTVTTNDLGNTGAGAPQQDVDVVSLTVGPVNDAPVNQVPGGQTLNEDSPLTFSAGNANAITVSDVDAADGTGELRVTLVVGQGTLVLGSTAGLVDVAGNGTSTTTMRGSVAALNAALEGLTYTGDADFNGPDSLTVITNDLGNEGSGGARQTTSTVALSVDAVNDAPVNSVPQATQTLDEDTTLTFSAGNGNAISVADLDAGEGTGQLRVSLSVGQGSLTLSQQTGLAVTGDGTGMVVLTGLVADVNAALEGLAYDPAADFNGADSLSVITDDLGNHGAPGALQDADVVALSVRPVNDAPLNQMPAAQSLNEDTSLTFSAGNGNAIVVSDVDVDEGTWQLQVILSVGQGSLTLSQQTGLAVTGDGTGTVELTGLVANVNAALQGLVYAPAADFNGMDALTVTTNDLGNFGAGGPQQDSDVVALTVAPVNDAPVNSVPQATQTLDEDASLTFSTGNGNAISVADLDAAEGTGEVQVTLAADQGALTLSQQTGLVVTGDGTGNVVLTGLVADVNAALQGLVYAPATDFNGVDSLTVTTNDLGNRGAPGALQDVDVVTLAVGPVNDAPVNAVPGTQILGEDTTHIFATGSGNAISVADLDATEGTGQLQVTLAVGQGSLTLSQQTGLSVTGDGTGTVMLTGLVANVNAALEGLAYAPAADFNGMDALTVTTNDLGNHGTPGALQDADTVSLMVTPINDAPVNSVPRTTQTLDEDTSLTFSAGNANAISVSDVDAAEGTGIVGVTLTVAQGSLTLSQQTGLSVTGDGTGMVVLTGLVANVNAALDGLAYVPVANFNGADALTVTTNDLANSGVGGPQQDVDVVALDVVPVNDAPVNSVPGSQTLDEDSTHTFSAGNGNAISVSDVDAADGTGEVGVTLSVNQGSLTLSQQTGLSVTGDGTGMVVLTGLVADVNAALQGLVYAPVANFNGADALTVTTNDLGNTGLGGPQQDVDVVALTVGAVNDAPVNSVPQATQTLDEDTPLTFSAAGGNAIAVSDVDAAEGTGEVGVTLSVGQGSLTLSQQTGLAVSGDGTGMVELTGLVAHVNAALQGLVYAPAADFNGMDALTVTTNDLGSFGAGGPQQDSDVVALTVAPVNDAPVNSVPGIQNVDEDTTLTFSAGNGNAIVVSDVDVDDGTGQLQVTLTVGQGSLTLSQQTGLNVTGDGTGNVMLTGLVANVNAALEGLAYVPAADFNGMDSLTVTTNDLDNSGAGGPQQDVDVVAISIVPVNDPPVNSVPQATQTLNEDTTLTFATGNGNAISVADLDTAEGTGELQVTLAVGQGSLTLSQQTGLAVTGDGTGTVMLTGLVADVNAALQGLVYAPAADFNGMDALTVTTDDLGNTGIPGALQDIDVVALRVDPVNDAPVNQVPASQILGEDTPLTFSAAGGNAISVSDVDVDDGTGEVDVRLSVGQGSLTLSQQTGLSVTGDGTASVMLTGLVADVNAALEGLVYASTADFNGTDALTVTTSDLGNSGAGGVRQDVDVVGLTVEPVNDAPVNSVPGSQVLAEESSLVFSSGNANLISVSDPDVDAGTGQVQVTLAAGRGALTLSQQTGLTVTGDGTGTVVLTGLVADVNAALDGLVYAPEVDFDGIDGLTVTTDDLGNTGAPGALQDIDTVELVVMPINDAPVNTVPLAPQVLDEDTELVFSSGNGNPIQIADVDSNSGSLRTTLEVDHGTLTVVTVDGTIISAPRIIIVQDDLTKLNGALDGLTYVPDADYFGDDTLTITTNDLGNTGVGGPMEDVDQVAIRVNPINDAPVNSVPAAQTLDEDTPLTFSAAGGNAIAIADDSGPNPIQLTLTVGQGSLTLSQQTGLSVAGDGTGFVTILGALSSVNAALEGLVYTPDLDFNGDDALTVTTDDLGNTGAGGPQQDVDVVALSVVPVNDAPVNQVPGGQTLNEDSPLTFSAGNGNAIAVADPDAAEGTGQLEVTLSVGQGSLTLSQQTGLSVTGDGTGTVVLTGLAANVNAALQGLVYAPATNFNGADALSITTSDLGNTGAPGPLQDVDMVALDVQAVNDAPANQVPGSQALDEDTTLTFASGNGNAIAVGDVDAAEGTGEVEVRLSVSQGSLTLSQQTGLTVTGNGTANVVMTGLVASANAALEGLVYAPRADFNGTDAVMVMTNDLGNTGAPGALMDVDLVPLEIRPVNDAPTNAVPQATQTLDEDTPHTFSAANGNALSVADVDVTEGTGEAQVLLSVDNGTLALGANVGLSFVSGNSTSTVLMRGSLLALNTALDGLSYTPDADFNGADSLTLTTDDLGNTGQGGAQQAIDSVALEVLPVNDAPVNRVPFQVIVDEDTDAIFSSAGGNAITVSDVDASELSVSLSVANGTLTLGSTAGLGSVVGNGTGSVTLTGPTAAINQALDGLAYRPDLDFNGMDSLSVVTDDGGSSGAGGPLQTASNVILSVAPVNDAPVIAAPGVQTVPEGGSLAFQGAAAVGATDVDLGNNIFEVRISLETPGNGSSLVLDLDGLVFMTPPQPTITFFASESKVNEVLSDGSLTYEAGSGFTGTEGIVFTVSDLGSSGSGGEMLDTETVTMSVVPTVTLAGETLASSTVPTGGDDVLTGTSEADVIAAGAGDDFVDGAGGDDVIDGGPGNDFLIGNIGDDTFVFATDSGQDTVADFVAGAGSDDTLDLRAWGFDDLSDLLAHTEDVAGDTRIELDPDTSVQLAGVSSADLSPDDFLI